MTEHLPSVRSISIGVWVDVGSRHESDLEAGLSHLVEHLVFKGTRTRNAAQIAAALESVGGSLNAFTTREQTCFTARVLDEFLPEAVEILADLTCHATLTPTNMSREKLVICEEIKESLDNPTDHIHDLFAETFWQGHAIGRPIMGSLKSISEMTRSRLSAFVGRHYRAASTVIAASGSVSHDRLLRLVRRYFELAPGNGADCPPAVRTPGRHITILNEDISQTQLCLGFPGLPYPDRRKMAMMVLAAHLGGGMSSVLFQEIREKRGLAYSIYSYHDFYKDTGIFGCYLGTDAKHAPNACEIILKECRRTARKKLTDNVLSQVKAQIKGHLTLGMESTSSRMSRLGRLELMIGSYVGLDEALAAIDEVTAKDVLEMAQLTFDTQQLAVAALGPIEQQALAGL